MREKRSFKREKVKIKREGERQRKQSSCAGREGYIGDKYVGAMKSARCHGDLLAYVLG